MQKYIFKGNKWTVDSNIKSARSECNYCHLYTKL